MRIANLLEEAKRIANPGCYATAAQLAIHPALAMLSGPPSVFGVSGYSGAGTKPGPRNDTTRLKDNLMPYALTGHKHEREISYHLGRGVHFSPHVHPAFSGLMTTVHLAFAEAQTSDDIYQRYKTAYGDQRLIRVQKDAPELKQGTGQSGVIIGGFAVSEDGRHGVVVAALDNLLKGAAVQAVQNLNLALAFDQYTAII